MSEILFEDFISCFTNSIFFLDIGVVKVKTITLQQMMTQVI